MELRAMFPVGSRVRKKGDPCPHENDCRQIRAGATGEIFAYQAGAIAVVWDHDFKGGHSLDGKLLAPRHKRGWYIHHYCLERSAGSFMEDEGDFLDSEVPPLLDPLAVLDDEYDEDNEEEIEDDEDDEEDND